MRQPLVEMENVSKTFGATRALDNVSMTIWPGEVHVLLGENGAGKSTLMKILSGVYQPSDGVIRVNGQVVERLNPKTAQEAGIAIIHQELSIINEISIAENIFLGRLPGNRGLFDRKTLEKMSAELLARVGLDMDPAWPAGVLKISQKQLVEIAKALSVGARVIVMDEPTSSLTPEEVEVLFKIINDLRKEGVGIVYISHKLEEIMEIGDRVTVLKDGTLVGSRPMDEEVTPELLVQMMVGSDLSSKYDTEDHSAVEVKSDKPITLKVEGLTRADGRCKDVSFEVREGEIVGFFGLVGSGRTEAMRALVGADPVSKGTVYLKGEAARISNPQAALKNGMGLIPEDRRHEGFCHNFPIWKNLTLPVIAKTSKAGGLWGLVNARKERQAAAKVVEQLNVRCASIEQPITQLSGGNQQKVVLGKWLETDLDIFIFDEPTRGIDVGVKASIYDIIKDLARDGKSILVVSSELPELLALCHRLMVFREGTIVAEFPISKATKENVLYAATARINNQGVGVQ
ncbi:MAG: sugar ABC transporter ATP-binding protein [Limnochordia bacterium]